MRLAATASLFIYTALSLSLFTPPATAEGTEAVPRVHIPRRIIDTGITPPEAQPSGTFTIGNSGSANLNIIGIEPSCGCTVAEPETRTIAPGEDIDVTVTVDPRGKRGRYRKTVTVRTDDPVEPVVEVSVTGEVVITEHGGDPDGSAIFSGKCASCHAVPASGKTGEPLFEAVCSVCHGHYGLGGMVAARINALEFIESHDDSYIRSIIENGMPRTSMPAFAEEAGGPLDAEQIDSLVDLIRWWEQGYIFKGNMGYREEVR